MKGARMSNIETLTKGGVILNPDQVPANDREKIESLSPEEVDALIKIRQKVGEHFGKNAPADTYSRWKMQVNL
jgi:hypothetical protein